MATELINRDVLKSLIERKVKPKQHAALHELLRQFPLGDSFSGRTIHRIIRLEQTKYRQPHSS